MVTLPTTPAEWDSTVSNVRGNITYTSSPGSAKYTTYYTTGAVASSSDGNGHSVSVNTSATNNYAAPSSITNGSLSSAFSWNGDLALTQAVGPNSSTSSYSYDSYARPTTTTSPTGEVTNYTYTNSPPTQTATSSNGRFTTTAMDGLGRPIKLQSVM